MLLATTGPPDTQQSRSPHSTSVYLVPAYQDYGHSYVDHSMIPGSMTNVADHQQQTAVGQTSGIVAVNREVHAMGVDIWGTFKETVLPVLQGQMVHPSENLEMRPTWKLAIRSVEHGICPIADVKYDVTISCSWTTISCNMPKFRRLGCKLRWLYCIFFIAHARNGYISLPV